MLTYFLAVVRPFGTYLAGSLITDEAIIRAVLASSNAGCVVQVNYPQQGGAPAVPTPTLPILPSDAVALLRDGTERQVLMSDVQTFVVGPASQSVINALIFG